MDEADDLNMRSISMSRLEVKGKAKGKGKGKAKASKKKSKKGKKSGKKSSKKSKKSGKKGKSSKGKRKTKSSSRKVGRSILLVAPGRGINSLPTPHPLHQRRPSRLPREGARASKIPTSSPR